MKVVDNILSLLLLVGMAGIGCMRPDNILNNSEDCLELEGAEAAELKQKKVSNPFNDFKRQKPEQIVILDMKSFSYVTNREDKHEMLNVLSTTKFVDRLPAFKPMDKGVDHKIMNGIGAVWFVASTCSKPGDNNYGELLLMNHQRDIVAVGINKKYFEFLEKIEKHTSSNSTDAATAHASPMAAQDKACK